MSLTLVALLMLVFFLVVMGVPIAFSIGASIVAYSLYNGFPTLNVLAQQTVMGMDSYVMLALPLFIWGGILMEKGGASDAIMNLIIRLIGKIPGGEPVASVIATAFFGSLTGSAVASTAAIGQIMEPQLVKRGYKPGFVVSLQAASGALGAVIPPGISIVAYGAIAGVSIKSLFAGAIVPAAITVSFLVAFAMLMSIVRKKTTEDELRYEDGSLARDVGMAEVFLKSLPGIFMPVIILGGIFSGIFTPTEAAAVACLYGLVIGFFVYRQLTIKSLYDSLRVATLATASITFIIAVSSGFAWILSVERLPQAFAGAMLELTSDPLAILLLMMLVILLLGTFMETISIIVILTPIFVPIATSIGIDPVHFGVIMILNLAIGSVTPPLGVCLFTAARIIKLDINETMPDLLYVVGIMVAALIFVTVCPVTVLWPSMLG